MQPLRFAPIFREYIWGGRRLATLLGKRLGDAPRYAESWEIVDHGHDQSIVSDGKYAGLTLQQLVRDHGEPLLGRHAPLRQFPLLLKFLDAQRNLSVQVHPNDEQAARLDPPDLGKTEAWVIVHAEPGSKIYAGLKRGFDRDALAREVHRGTTELCLHQFAPQAGDCIFIPAGTVHALGAGLVVAEIQQASDTTFRLFDWNRVGDDGQPRPLHVEQGLAVIDFDRGPVHPVEATAADDHGYQELVNCSKFILGRWTTDRTFAVGGNSSCHIVTVLQGEVDVSGDPANRPLSLGESMLLPASAGSVQITPRRPTILMQAHLP